MSLLRTTYGLRRLLPALALIMVIASGCVTNPATGEKEFSLLSREQEIELGQRGDAEIVAQFGVYNDEGIARYVDSLGQALAAKSDDPALVWTFRVLDSPVINAFALPGGFVYVTRGLLSYMGNEAQLAVVLGHEIGHVTARHTARQYTTQQLAGIGIGLGSILFEDVRPFLGAIETGLSLLFLQYSRDDERQADALGVRYAARLNYKASEGSEFFNTLGRIQDQSQGGGLPTWASTHPDPAEREATIIRLAEEEAAKNPGVVLVGTSSEAFLPRFDNIVFGENPRHGFISDGIFYHPELSFQFPVPSNWQLANFATQVQMAPNTENADAAIIMQATSGTTPSQAASAFIDANSAQVIENSAGTVNGLVAQRVRSNLTVEGGGSLAVLSYFIQKDDMLYIFHGYTVADRYSVYAATFEGVFTNFRRLTDGAVLSVQPNRLDVFSSPRTDVFSSLVVPNPQIGMDLIGLAILNQVETVSTTIQVGSALKQVP